MTYCNAYVLYVRTGMESPNDFHKHSTFLDDPHSFMCLTGTADLIETRMSRLVSETADIMFGKDRQKGEFEKPCNEGTFRFVKIEKESIDKKEYDRLFALKYPESQYSTHEGTNPDGTHRYSNKSFRQAFFDDYGEWPEKEEKPFPVMKEIDNPILATINLFAGMEISKGELSAI